MVDPPAWYALAALILTAVVQVVRKSPVLRDLWRSIPDGWRWLVPVLAGASTGLIHGLESGVPLLQLALYAGAGALGISLPAMGLHALLRESPVPWDGGSGGWGKGLTGTVGVALPELDGIVREFPPPPGDE
jgi:hypothetical protein